MSQMHAAVLFAIAPMFLKK